MAQKTQENEPSRYRGRQIAIGDIHGCSVALRTLLDALAPRREDTIIALGDFVDWGPDSRGVIGMLIELSGRCNLVALLGNHEEMLLDALESDSAMRRWLDFGGEETLASYPYLGGPDIIPEDQVRFLRSCHESYETLTHIFVHANYDPRLPLDRTGATTLRWRSLDEDATQPHFSGKTVVVGHTPQVSGNVLDLGFVVCIDTDCSRGGWLTALEVNSRAIAQANQMGETRTSVLAVQK